MINPGDVHSFLAVAEQVDPNPANFNLYKHLIEEEYKELMDALHGNDEAHTLNEAMDLIWVVIGYCHTRGYDISGAWAALSQANHAKLQVDPETGKLLRHPNGKIKKPENWKPADFRPFVDSRK